MIRKHNITATLALAAFLTACSSEETTPTYTVGEADNAIVLRAGVTGQDKAQTRAAAIYNKFSKATQLRLRMDGTWTGHDPVAVSQTTTGTTAASPTVDSDNDDSHVLDTHDVIFSGTGSTAGDKYLYWDDYGTADPANASTGRVDGLTIYGVAIDGSTSAPAVSDWESLSWPLDANQTSGWTAKDLLTSNNVKDGTPESKPDNRYKWSEHTTGKLLEFTHAMTKVTVVLTAGEGFKDGKFVNNPTVTLKGFKTTGNVNVITKVSTPTGEATDIKAHLSTGGASSATATFDALVYPEREIIETSKNQQVLVLTADGNNYEVNANKLYEAMSAKSQTEMLQGYNYLLKITVNKTKIQVTATIVDWNTVEAATETPVINISDCFGQEATDGRTNFEKGFSFLRSTSINNGYSKDAVVNYADSKYTMTPQLYWPNHSTHYFFRGVWPLIGETDGPTNAQVTASNIAVENVAYTQNTYPSDLMLGYPRTTTETCTHGNVVASKGICATEGEERIRMNFQYVMSQVEVRLTTNTGETDAVNLANAKVEIVNGYTEGNINLSDGSATPTGDKDDYTLNPITGADRDGVAAANIRHSAVLPQALTYTTAGATTNLRFKITIYNSSDPDDVDIYYADINPILEKGKTTKVAPNGKWEAGVHYIYNLDIRKTAIKVTATLTDWITVTASDNVWF